MISTLLAVATAVASTILTVVRVRRSFDSDTRDYEDFFSDVQVMNQNNSYFVAAIVIFLGFAVEGTILSNEALVLLLMGFLAGSASIFFYPVTKTSKGGSLSQVKGLWLFKVVATQWTVIFTVFGISTVVLERVGI